MVSINIDISLFIQLANFLILIVLLNYFLYRPIRKILDDRRDLFERLKNKADKAKTAIEKGETEKNSINIESKKKAELLRSDIVSKSQLNEQSILAEANEKAERLINDGKSKLASSFNTAKDALSKEMESFAQEMADKALGRTQ